MREALPDEWWPFFATLVFTGLRFGEAHGLRGGDLRLQERRIIVQDAIRRVKTASSVRHVPIPEPLAELLGQQLARHPCGPADQVFSQLSEGYSLAYRKARRVWQKAAIGAGLHDGRAKSESAEGIGGKPKRKPLKPNATIHDLRHIFGVHAAESGVPIARLQVLMGHSTPIMTMRYLKHAPEAYFAEDAARIAGSLTGDIEAAERAALARKASRVRNRNDLPTKCQQGSGDGRWKNC